MAGTGQLAGQELQAACQEVLNAELQQAAVAGRDYTLNLQVKTYNFIH